MRADAFALGGHQCRGLFPRRLDHDARGLARLVGSALRYEVDAIVVVALPGGVALAERIERGTRDGVAIAIRVRAGFEDEEPARRQRHFEGNWIGGARHVPLAGRDFLPLRLPRVEAVAFCAPDADPLNLRQPDIDWNAGDRDAVEADRDELR